MSGQIGKSDLLKSRSKAGPFLPNLATAMSAVLLISYPRSPKTTRMSLRQAEKTRARYELKQGQSRVFHQLPSGLSMEVIVQKRRSGKEEKAAPPPPLVLVHGSFHAAWCWAEHWMPFFSKYGHDCYAVSLLGQGESDLPSGPAAGTLQTHASDVAHFIEKEVELEPVLVGHSFGGLIVQYYISSMMSGHLRDQTSGYGKKGLHPALAGAVLVCSVPPSGNSGLVWRYLRSKPVAAFKISIQRLSIFADTIDDDDVTLSLAAKAFATSLPLCRETFFSAGMEDHNVQRHGTSAPPPAGSAFTFRDGEKTIFSGEWIAAAAANGNKTQLPGRPP
ncbi:hypothetical protein ACLOJK_032995 [Asimina triloba]